MLGDLPHVDVAAAAHEHSAHRPPQYQWSLASTAIAPRFSIITPVYDPPLGTFLACAEGVRSQTFADWEWCLVDDCSTRPEIRTALDKLAADDARVRVLHRTGNGGILERRNCGRVERRVVDGARRIRHVVGPRRRTGSNRARADGRDARVDDRHRLRLQR